jgi:hypothetical protein
MATALCWLSDSADVLFVTFVFLPPFSESQVVVTDAWRRRTVTTPRHVLDDLASVREGK